VHCPQPPASGEAEGFQLLFHVGVQGNAPPLVFLVPAGEA
jgi:hypothetical protein